MAPSYIDHTTTVILYEKLDVSNVELASSRPVLSQPTSVSQKRPLDSGTAIDAISDMQEQPDSLRHHLDASLPLKRRRKENKLSSKEMKASEGTEQRKHELLLSQNQLELTRIQLEVAKMNKETEELRLKGKSSGESG